MTLVFGVRTLTGAQQEMIISTKVKKPDTETDKGVPLAPPEKDLKPWYSEKGKGRTVDDMDKDMRSVFQLGGDLSTAGMSHILHSSAESAT